jgi:hypothetical protein
LCTFPTQFFLERSTFHIQDLLSKLVDDLALLATSEESVSYLAEHKDKRTVVK